MLWLQGALLAYSASMDLLEGLWRLRELKLHLTSNGQYDIYIPLSHDVVTARWLLTSYSS